jgi:hypothetical protein
MRIGLVKRPLPSSSPVIVYLMDRCLPTMTGGSSASPRPMSNPVDVADPFIYSQQGLPNSVKLRSVMHCVGYEIPLCTVANFVAVQKPTQCISPSKLGGEARIGRPRHASRLRDIIQAPRVTIRYMFGRPCHYSVMKDCG